MKKKFKLDSVDCANCAEKMAALIRKIPGVNDASINFMTQRLVIDAQEDAFPEILKQAQKACDRVEKGCLIKV